MKKVYLSILSLAMATLFLGCSEDAAATSYLEGSPVTITTVEEASNTLSTVGSLADAGTAGTALAVARTASQKAMSLAPSLTPSLASYTQACPYGGSLTIDGASETSFTGTYSDCDLGTVVADGSISVSGDTLTYSNLTMTDSTYGISLMMNMSIVDVGGTGADVTINGTIAMTDSTDSASFGYQNFHVITRTNYDININGDISINSTTYPCNNGTFAISTIDDLTPFGDAISSGTMKVNGVTFDFISSTQVTVTFADGTSETVTQGLASICTAN